MNDKQLARLKSSIQKYGFIVPIITNKELLVADGEQRLIIARQLGIPKVPVIRLPIEDVDRRLLRQVLNKLRGEHELIADALEFERIIEAGHEDELKHLLDLSDVQLLIYLQEVTEIKDETFSFPAMIDTVTTDIKMGDKFRLGNHILLCGDVTRGEDVEKLCNPQKAHLLLTDPPYNVDYQNKEEYLRKFDKGRYTHGDIPQDKIADLEGFLSLCLRNVAPYLENYNSYYITFAGKTLRYLLNALENEGYKLGQILVWFKQHFVLGRADYRFQHEFLLYGWRGKHKFYGKNEKSVWQIDRPRRNLLHPTMKPLKLLRRAINNSIKPKDIVLDPFGGSGSTLIACQQTGRTCYMMEIDPRYCQVIIDRWESYTNQKAEKIN